MRQLIKIIPIITFLFFPVVQAQEMEVPLELQFKLILKALSFDRSLPERCGDSLDFCILYQSKFLPSEHIKREVLRMAQNDSRMSSLDNIPIAWKTLDLQKPADLTSIIQHKTVDILYVTPLRTVDITSIADFCRSYKINSVTGVTEYLDRGLALAIGAFGDKPMLIINLPAAKAEGADYSSQLLKLSKVIE